MTVLLHYLSGKVERIYASNLEVDPDWDKVLMYVKDGNMEKISLLDVYKMEVMFE